MISYDDWHKKIENALTLRNNYWNGDKAWKRFLALYRGDHWKSSRYSDNFTSPDSETPRDRITVNVTGSTILLAKSFLINKHPKFIINPRPILDQSEVQQAVIGALLQQEVLNYEWKEREMNFQCKEAVLDALIIGHGIVKNGFMYKKPKATNKKKDGEIEYRSYMEDEVPYLTRINPFMFLFDTDHMNYRDLDSGSWCAEIFFNSREDVLANSSYNKTILKSISDGDEKPETINLSYNADDTLKAELNRDILYEVWDRKFEKRYIFLKGIEQPLLEEEWPYDYLDGFPYQKLDFIPIPNEHYGVGIPYFIEDQQLELNRIRTAMFDHRRRFNRKYLAIEGAITPEEVTKIITGETGTFAWVNQANAIAPMEEGKTPQDAFSQESIIKNDIQELSGVDKLARGGDMPSRTSAAEIEARKQFTNLKLDDRSEDVDIFYSKTARKVLQHIQENYTKDKVIQISGVKGNYWIKYSPSDIKGEFAIDMETVSAPPEDETTQKQQAIQMFQLIMQNMQFLMQAKIEINWQELFKWIFSKFGEKDTSRFFSAASPISGLPPFEGQQQPNTALNLNQGGMPQMPQVMSTSDLKAGLSGGMSGGGIPNQQAVM